MELWNRAAYHIIPYMFHMFIVLMSTVSKYRKPSETVALSKLLTGTGSKGRGREYLYICRSQFAVSNQHHSDDVKCGLIQSLSKDLHQLVGDLWTCQSEHRRAKRITTPYTDAVQLFKRCNVATKCINTTIMSVLQTDPSWRSLKDEYTEYITLYSFS